MQAPMRQRKAALSLEGTRKCKRYRQITVEYQDIHLKKQRQDYSGWIAQIIQHECDPAGDSDLRRGTMQEKYKVIEIFERDYGCEERAEGQTDMVQGKAMLGKWKRACH